MEVVKKAEKTNDTIVRIYEPYGKKAVVKLAVAGFARAYATDLMEWNELQRIEIIDGIATIALKPFEIFTLKLTR